MHARLTRRGLTLPGVLAAAFLAEGSARAIPPSVTVSTARAVLSATRGGPDAAVRAGARELAENAGYTLKTKGRASAALLLFYRAIDRDGPAPCTARAGGVAAEAGRAVGTRARRDPPRADRFGDPLPEGALVRYGTIRYRPGDIEGCALSPDGKTLATAGDRPGPEL